MPVCGGRRGEEGIHTAADTGTCSSVNGVNAVRIELPAAYLVQSGHKSTANGAHSPPAPRPKSCRLAEMAPGTRTVHCVKPEAVRTKFLPRVDMSIPVSQSDNTGCFSGEDITMWQSTVFLLTVGNQLRNVSSSPEHVCGGAAHLLWCPAASCRLASTPVCWYLQRSDQCAQQFRLGFAEMHKDISEGNHAQLTFRSSGTPAAVLTQPHQTSAFHAGRASVPAPSMDRGHPNRVAYQNAPAALVLADVMRSCSKPFWASAATRLVHAGHDRILLWQQVRRRAVLPLRLR